MFVIMTKSGACRVMKFVGSTIIYSYLQAIGIINGHLPGCHKYHEVGPTPAIFQTEEEK